MSSAVREVWVLGRRVYWLAGRATALTSQACVLAPGDWTWLFTLYGEEAIPPYVILTVDPSHQQLLVVRLHPMTDYFRFQTDPPILMGIPDETLTALIATVMQYLHNPRQCMYRFRQQLGVPLGGPVKKKLRYASSTARSSSSKKPRQYPEYVLLVADHDDATSSYTCTYSQHYLYHAAVGHRYIRLADVHPEWLDTKDMMVCRKCVLNMPRDIELGDVVALLATNKARLPTAAAELVLVLRQVMATTPADLHRHQYGRLGAPPDATVWTVPEPVNGLWQHWDLMRFVMDQLATNALAHATKLGFAGLQTKSHAQTAVRCRLTALVAKVVTLQEFGLVQEHPLDCRKTTANADDEALWQQMMDQYGVALTPTRWVLRSWVPQMADLLVSLPSTWDFVGVSLFDYALRMQVFQARPGQVIKRYWHVHPDDTASDLPTNAYTDTMTMSACLERLAHTPEVPATTQIIVWPAHAIASPALLTLLSACRHIPTLRVAGMLYVGSTATQYLFTRLVQTHRVQFRPLRPSPTSAPLACLTTPFALPFSPPTRTPSTRATLRCPYTPYGTSPWVVANVIYRAQVQANWTLAQYDLAFEPSYCILPTGDVHASRPVWHDKDDSDQTVWRTYMASNSAFVILPPLNTCVPVDKTV